MPRSGIIRKSMNTGSATSKTDYRDMTCRDLRNSVPRLRGLNSPVHDRTSPLQQAAISTRRRIYSSGRRIRIVFADRDLSTSVIDRPTFRGGIPILRIEPEATTLERALVSDPIRLVPEPACSRHAWCWSAGAANTRWPRSIFGCAKSRPTSLLSSWSATQGWLTYGKGRHPAIREG